MKLARVIGNVVCTIKDARLTGKKILLLQEIDDTGSPCGEPLAALDAVGVGSGEMIFFVTSKEAAFPFDPDEIPTDACVLGVIDHINLSSSSAGH
ncbi:MAG: EutN/CcmL family microcompartment protein [Acidobacteria bacterium]|nr:EutN/CcmL family microcompartment protein [Acidobacteriota bacterium]